MAPSLSREVLERIIERARGDVLDQYGVYLFDRMNEDEEEDLVGSIIYCAISEELTEDEMDCLRDIDSIAIYDYVYLVLYGETRTLHPVIKGPCRITLQILNGVISSEAFSFEY